MRRPPLLAALARVPVAVSIRLDINRTVETALLVAATLALALALRATSVPALQRPATALVEQTLIAVAAPFVLGWISRHRPSAPEESPAPPLPLDTSSRPPHTHHRIASRPRSGPPASAPLAPVSRQADADLLWGVRSERYLRLVQDQGVTPGLLFGPLVSAACLLDAYRSEQAEAHGYPLSDVGHWRLPPWPLSQGPAAPYDPPQLAPGLGPLSSARLAMSAVTTLMFIINVTHLVAVRVAPRSWVFPRGGLARARNVVLFYTGVTATLMLASPAGLLEHLGVSIAGQGTTPATGGLAAWEVLATSTVFQVSLLMTVLLGRRNFTYAELVIAVMFGSMLVMEAFNLMVAKLMHSLIPHTMRAPTALLIYQLALIIGTFSLGFLTSPLLYLSRYLAQRPTHRLRWPEKRHQNRKLLSISFYTLSIVFIGGILGPWVQSFLHTNPWVWAVRFGLNLETITSPPNSVPWANWSFNPHLQLTAWWAVCLLASIAFWWRANGGFSPSEPSSSSSPSFLTPPTFSAARCFGPLRALQKRAMSPLVPKSRKRRSFTTRPRLATSASGQGSSIARIKMMDIVDANSSATSGPTPMSHGNSSDTESDSSPSEQLAPFPPRSPMVPADKSDTANGPAPPSGEKGDLLVDVDTIEAPSTTGAPSPPPLPRPGTTNNVQHLSLPPTATASTGAKRYPPVLSLNAKRKFFHLLAILLFVPGFILDPVFVHLALSLAFSFFILCEYTRFFALYPLGAPLHVFLTRFTDNKDTGPVLLSPFYLLLGCALPLWAEARPSALARSSAALALGVSDAAASWVGQHWGRTHWPQSRKTVEGTLGFIASLAISGGAIHLIAPSRHWSWPAWLATASALGLLEGVSEQNDNLTLPLYSLALTSLFEL